LYSSQSYLFPKGSANVDSFVEWVWGVFGQEQKSTETPKKDPETNKTKEIEKKQPNKNIGIHNIRVPVLKSDRIRQTCWKSSQWRKFPLTEDYP